MCICLSISIAVRQFYHKIFDNSIFFIPGKITVGDEVRRIGMDMNLMLPNTDYTSVAKLMQGDTKIGIIQVYT